MQLTLLSAVEEAPGPAPGAGAGAGPLAESDAIVGRQYGRK
jgi:hypothetical protein